MKEILSKLFGKIKENKTPAIIAAILTVVLVVAAVGAAYSTQHHDTPADNPSSSELVSSEPVSEDANLKEESQIVESDETEAGEDSAGKLDEAIKEEPQASDTEDTDASKPSSNPSVKPTTNKKPTTSKKPTSSTASKPSTSSGSSSSTKKDYFDASELTGTQADVGKVVGYDSIFSESITVVSVVETTTADGRKCVETTYSNCTATTVVECEYCHKFPCPNGGGKGCLKYNAEEDAAVTCQTCSRPIGNGYDGTCEQTIDWSHGGKISCNHYD